MTSNDNCSLSAGHNDKDAVGAEQGRTVAEFPGDEQLDHIAVGNHTQRLNDLLGEEHLGQVRIRVAERVQSTRALVVSGQDLGADLADMRVGIFMAIEPGQRNLRAGQIDQRGVMGRGHQLEGRVLA